MNQLQRVQVYLNPNDLDLIDYMALKIRVNRSQIIRDLVSTTADRYIKLLELLDKKVSKKNPLLELAGIAKSKTGTLGINVDEIYEHD